jgi:CubicO group peptidase (beta-lactamase class C family)
VHDGNAHFLGGAAGNAGLFGTAAAVASLAREVLGAPHGLLGATLRRALLAARPAGPERRALFGSLAMSPGSTGAPFSRRAVGHSGFTGTSLWVDPENEGIIVLLTNRVHPSVREGFDMDAVRLEFHARAVRMLER